MMRGISVADPDEPISASPAMVASPTSGPPPNWVISAFTPYLVKNPFSCAIHQGV